MLIRNKIIIISIVILGVIGVCRYYFQKYGSSILNSIYIHMVGEKTVSDVVIKIEPSVKKRLEPYFKIAQVNYLPEKLSFLIFKKDKRLEVWGENSEKWCLIISYPILAASGELGPKLKEGDKQVPEGIYKIIDMNPNSCYHLSMLINYPNSYDKQKAELQSRTELGDEICIHGKAVSSGCLAMGDLAIEDLFVIVNRVGMENIKVIIAPYDFRGLSQNNFDNPNIPWISELYIMIKQELIKY